MNILYLYGNDNALPLAQWLCEQGNDVTLCNEKLSTAHLSASTFDLTISYSYKYILSQPILDILNGNCINMHISYLPWNRGENPCPWSFIERTPQGVSIHYINDGLDKGDIIAQRMVPMNPLEETLQSSYDKLNTAIVLLFKEIYPYYFFWEEMRKHPLGKGSYHNVADFSIFRTFIDDWNMPVSDFLNRVGF